MRKQLARTILAAGTVAAALCLSIPPAMASGTCTVSGGPNFTAVQASGATFKLAFGATTLTCTTATAQGSVIDGTLVNPFGHVTGSTFGDSTHPCTAGLNSAATEAQKAGANANLSLSSYSVPVAGLTISNIDEILTFTAPIHCSTEITGTVGSTYNNSTDEVNFATAGDNLTVVGTGCNGIINQGDHPTFSSSGGGEIVIGSPVNPIQITCP